MDARIDPNIDDALFALTCNIQQTREEFAAWVADTIDTFEWELQRTHMRLEHNADNDMEN